MSAIILQDEIVHYEVLGRGRPLIFLHGWVGSWRYWIPTMQAASVSFRAYALDLWGFGDTAKNPANYEINQQLNLLDLFLQEMGIGKIALIGHGLGAALSLLFAAQNQRLVDRVMAVSLPYAETNLNSRLQSSSPVELADWLLDRSPTGEAVRAEATKADPAAIQLSLEKLRAVDLGKLPYTLPNPCLLVYGQNDPVVASPDPNAAQIYPENIHQITFEQSGHFPMLNETSKFNRLMADFLALGPGESPRRLQLKEEWKRRVR
jgi:3-oxoadipate enol-lactonase